MILIFPFRKQDNVFVQIVCSTQYRIIKEFADDAFYELQNPKEQIRAYVFDGTWIVAYLQVVAKQNFRS